MKTVMMLIAACTLMLACEQANQGIDAAQEEAKTLGQAASDAADAAAGHVSAAAEDAATAAKRKANEAAAAIEESTE